MQFGYIKEVVQGSTLESNTYWNSNKLDQSLVEKINIWYIRSTCFSQSVVDVEELELSNSCAISLCASAKVEHPESQILILIFSLVQ